MSSDATRDVGGPGSRREQILATAADLFGADPEGLWMRVLRRQPGELAWVSTRPHDPTLN